MEYDNPPSHLAPTNPEWSVQELQKTHAARLVPLFDTVWPSNVSNEQYARWAFEASPTGNLVLTATLNDDRSNIVGARGSILWPLQEEGPGALKVHQLSGTCVHPDFRRRGIFTQLNLAFLERFKEAGGDCVFNVSVDKSRAGYEKIGWSYLPGLRRLILPVRPLRIARAAMTTEGEIRGAPTSLEPGDEPPDFESISYLNEARKVQLGTQFFTRYSRSFFNWRFSRKMSGYRFLVIDGTGMVCYKTGRRCGLRDMVIGDLWIIQPTVVQLARLLWPLMRRERPDLVSVVTTRAHPLHGRLRSLGFVPDPKGDLNLGVRPVTRRGEALLDPGRWALMMADIDTF